MNWKLRKAFTGNNTSDVQTINGYIAAGEDNDFSVEVSPVGKEYPAPLVVPRTNLLLQSNQFDTTWGSSGITLTGGEAGYDGSDDAWKMEKTAAAFRQITQSVSSSGVNTFSVYAKAGTLDIVTLFYNVVPNHTAVEFNLFTQVVTVSSATNYISHEMVDVGGGWFRCSMTYEHVSGDILRIYPDFEETDAGYIYIQDAQLEAGDTATEYIPTTTEAVTRSWDSFSRVQNQVPGICNGTHTHTGAASGGGIAATTLTGTGSGGKFKYQFDTLGKLTLIEAMTHENLLLQSNQFNTTWTVQAGASVTGGQADKDGGNNAWLLAKTADYSRVEQTTSVSGLYTLSVYAKADTLGWLSFENSGITSDLCFFDLVNGDIGSRGAGVISHSIQGVGNGWYRCSAVFSGALGITRFQPSVSNDVVNGTNGNIYIQDAQLEEGSQATGYIETTTAPVREGAGQGYRVDDKLSITTNEGHDIEFRLVEGSNATTVTVGMEATKPSKPVPFPVTKMRVADSTDRRVLIMDQRSRYVFPKPTPYLLDSYEGAAAAYSLRRLRSAYTGPAVRVRRESNNDELDIYFDGQGNLDTASLEAFCAGTNGFVKVWYDQSGSGADLEQGATARQGVIVSAGTTLTDADGLPYVNAIVSTYDNPIQISQPFTAFAAAQFGGGYRRLMLGGVLWSPDLTNNRFNAGLNMTGTIALTFANKELYGILANGTSSEMRYNGTSDATGNVGTNAISTSTTFFSQAAPSNAGPERAYEMVIFSGDQSANFTGIETNINDFYNIY